MVASLTSAFNEAMLAEGFIQEDRSGFLHVGFYHFDHPRFGYQQVSKPLFDGLSDMGKLLRVEVTADGDAVTLPSVEDMIADRLGQYAAGPTTDMSRLHQARTLFKLAADLDMKYLLRRISDEQGDATLLEL